MCVFDSIKGYKVQLFKFRIALKEYKLTHITQTIKNINN